MIKLKVLDRYLARQFLLSLLIVIGIVFSIIFLVDAVEMFRRTQAKDIKVLNIISVIFFRTPVTIQEVLPIIIIIAGMHCYTKLAKSNELTILRSVGVSLWQFMLPSLFASFVFGLIYIFAITPVTSKFHVKAEVMKEKLLMGNHATASALSSGIWFKDYHIKEGNLILHADNISHDGNNLFGLTSLIYSNDFEFKKRYDAEYAIIKEDFWILKNVNITNSKNQVSKQEEVVLHTNTNVEKLQDSFAKPQNFSIWDLPQFINNLQKAGFPALRHTQYYYYLFSLPFLLAAMSLIPGCFVTKINNRNKFAYEIILGVLFSFLLYFSFQSISVLALAGTIPLFLSVIAPVILTFAIASFMIIHREEG